MATRTIVLRRPAVLSVAATPFVPEGLSRDAGLAAEVERRWGELCAGNRGYFDGRLYHVAGVSRNGHGGATLHVMECAYRYHAVQTADFDLGQRALGVKGVTSRVVKGAGGVLEREYLFGQRSKSVAAYRGLWEFAPAGGVEPGREPAEVARQELEEETGYEAKGEAVGIAVMFDEVLKCWELVFAMEVVEGAGEADRRRTGEYDALEWRRLVDAPRPMSPIAEEIRRMMKARG